MKRWLVAAIIAGALLPKLAFAAGSVVELPAGVGDEVNVTSDSAAGWVPTVDQRVAAVQTAQHFIDAVEQGHFAEAYGLFAAPVKAHRTMAEFEQDESKFQALAGPARFWRVHRLTWTKDPSRAPAPGVYVAIDLSAKFANIDRDCGYLVLYQAPKEAGFTVMRRENNYLDNATARQIAAQKSPAEVDRLWSQMARFCPNG